MPLYLATVIGNWYLTVTMPDAQCIIDQYETRHTFFVVRTDDGAYETRCLTDVRRGSTLAGYTSATRHASAAAAFADLAERLAAQEATEREVARIRAIVDAHQGASAAAWAALATA